jgi:hypothetical protein
MLDSYSLDSCLRLVSIHIHAAERTYRTQAERRNTHIESISSRDEPWKQNRVY